MTVYDKPIVVERKDEETQEWAPVWNLHAAVNYSQGTEHADGGSQRSVQTLTFKVRWFAGLKDVARNTQLYRIAYDGATFDIQTYDDFMERHREARMQAASYG